MSVNGGVPIDNTTIFIFNFNECGDIIGFDNRLIPVLLEATTEYSTLDGMLFVIVRDGNEIYSLLVDSTHLILINNKTQILFYNEKEK